MLDDRVLICSRFPFPGTDYKRIHPKALRLFSVLTSLVFFYECILSIVGYIVYDVIGLLIAINFCISCSVNERDEKYICWDTLCVY